MQKVAAVPRAFSRNRKYDTTYEMVIGLSVICVPDLSAGWRPFGKSH